MTAYEGDADRLPLEERAALLGETEGIARVGSYLWEPGRQPVWTDGMFRILGYEPGAVEPGAEVFHRLVHPDDRDRIQQAHADAREGRLPDIEYRILRADTGEERHIRGTGRIYLEDDGRTPRRMIGTLLDITEQRHAALRDERALAMMRHAERVARMGSFMVDLEPMKSTWSRGLFDLLGLVGEEVDGSTWLRFMHPDDLDAHTRWFMTLMERGEMPPIRSRHYNVAGEMRHTLTHAAPVQFESDGSRHIVGATIDITEQVALEERLRHMAKMEAVGTLAAGVAHDFNNYLMVIQGCFAMLGRSGDVPEPMRGLTTQAQHAATRCMELTQQLLAFARRRQPRRELTRLDELIGRIGTLVSPSLGEGVELVVSVTRETLHAEVDPAHLEQVLVNLAINGRDAIRDAGRETGMLEVTIERCVLDRPQSEVPAEVGAGRWACIHVSDDGVGVSGEDLPRIFEPYFTTKAAGRGTGLGLAAAYGVVQQHGGHITVRSTPGEGSRFTIWLPEAEPGAVRQAKPDIGTGTREEAHRVLVVDDMPEVRAVTAMALRTAGFDVQEAGDGVEALAMLDAGDFEVVLTDVRMPRMDGPTLAAEAAKKHPTAQVILMTGYADGARAEGGLPVLEKPVSPDDLERVVRSCLRDARGDG